MWVRASQLYTQEDPKISTYESSYQADTPHELSKFNQQIRIGFRPRGQPYLKELDPRAGYFRVRLIDEEETVNSVKGKKTYTDLETDWCNQADLNHLNMVNKDAKGAGNNEMLCIKDSAQEILNGL